MSAKHTPGPWSRGKYGQVIDANGQELNFRSVTIYCSGEKVAEAEANTNLAVTAPELLDTTAALLFVVRALANELGIDPETTRFRFTANEKSIGDIRLSDVYERADALVAKATGAAS